mgnify:CR=1 FL=1|jgi:dTDP-4-amino-4,6-dideoxygalactose transaminase
MKNLQLVDLLGQYDKISQEIDEAVISVIKSGAYINGPEVKKFQAELENYLNVKHVIPVANGTDALQIALMALGLKPGDEVITPSFTYIATAEVIALLGLNAVFVEVDPVSFTIDPSSFENAIGPKTKAVIPVHLYGHAAKMDSILEIAKKHNIAVVEDTAQAIGSHFISENGEKTKVGTMGDVGCTSFFPSKNLGCFGDGGAMFTNDDELAAKIRMIANHGQSKKYYHDVIGVNSRLDSIQAAILRIKLRHLDEYIIARNNAANAYTSAFNEIEEIESPSSSSWSDHGYHQYTIKLKGNQRDALQVFLNDKGIPCNIYYPVPIHKQKGFEGKYEISQSLDTTEDLCSRVLSFPMHTELEAEQIEFITNSVKEFFKQ